MIVILVKGLMLLFKWSIHWRKSVSFVNPLEEMSIVLSLMHKSLITYIFGLFIGNKNIVGGTWLDYLTHATILRWNKASKNFPHFSQPLYKNYFFWWYYSDQNLYLTYYKYTWFICPYVLCGHYSHDTIIKSSKHRIQTSSL